MNDKDCWIKYTVNYYYYFHNQMQGKLEIRYTLVNKLKDIMLNFYSVYISPINQF